MYPLPLSLSFSLFLSFCLFPTYPFTILALYIIAPPSYVSKVLDISWERFVHIPLQWGSSTSRDLPLLGNRGFFYGLASNLHVIALGGRLDLSLSLILKIHLSYRFGGTTFVSFLLFLLDIGVLAMGMIWVPSASETCSSSSWSCVFIWISLVFNALFVKNTSNLCNSGTS